MQQAYSGVSSLVNIGCKLGVHCTPMARMQLLCPLTRLETVHTLLRIYQIVLCDLQIACPDSAHQKHACQTGQVTQLPPDQGWNGCNA